MEFFDTGFLFFAPLFILFSFIIKKPNRVYILNILAVVNVLLVFHSIFIIRQYYAFYQLAKALNIQPDPNMKIEIGWYQVKDWLIILLPFLFLIKPISYNRILSCFMIFLLKYDWFVYVAGCIKGNSHFYLNTYFPYHFGLHCINYISWFILLYALFWFIKYLPFNTKFK